MFFSFSKGQIVVMPSSVKSWLRSHFRLTTWSTGHMVEIYKRVTGLLIFHALSTGDIISRKKWLHSRTPHKKNFWKEDGSREPASPLVIIY